MKSKHSNLTNPNSLLTKGTLLATSSLTIMAGATIAPSLPAMQAYFSGVEHGDYLVRLILTVPALFIVIGAPVVGLTIDRAGRKSLLVTSVLLYSFAGSSGFILNSLNSILFGRALLGLSVAGIMVCVTTLIADYYSGQARATFMGLQAAFMGFGGVIFLSTGGMLADLNWRMPFLIYLSALLLLPLILLSISEQNYKNTKVNKGQSGEPQSNLPPVKLLVLIYSIALLMQVIFYLIPVQLPFYLQALTRASATQGGLAIAITTFFSALASMTYGQVKSRLSYINITILTFGLMGSGYIVLGLASSYRQVLVGLSIAGVGLGLLMPNLNVWLTAKVPETQRGGALGGLSTFFFLGQFLSPIVSQAVSQQVGLGLTYSLAGGLLMVLSVVFASARQQIAALTMSSLKKLAER